MRDYKSRLMDILEAIEKIEARMNAKRDDELSKEDLQIYVTHFLMIIGEACSNLPSSVREEDNSIPWKEIIGLKNIIVHHYFEIADEIIWDTVISDLPIFKEKVIKLLESTH